MSGELESIKFLQLEAQQELNAGRALRASAFNKAANLLALRASSGGTGWQDVLRECADDLEAELRDRYRAVISTGAIHPAYLPKFDRDMEPVKRARALLHDAHPASEESK